MVSVVIRRTATAVFASVVGAGLLSAHPAAAKSPDELTAAEAAMVVAEATAVEGAPAATAAADVVETSVGVVSDLPGSPVSLVLPEARVSGEVSTATVVDGEGDSQAVVQDVGGQGQRVAFIINSAEDPTEYQVDFDGAASLVVDSAGGVVALDGAGQVVAVVDAPWARDASGTEVPTRFVVEGTTLTQVVDHTTATFAYPIVADPAVWSWWGVTYYLNRRETVSVAVGWGVGLGIVGRIPGPVGWVLTGAVSGAFGYASFVSIWGGCLAVTANYWNPRHPRVWHYYGGYCR